MPEWPLVHLFLKRFVDNDLISPDADRHAVLAVTLGAVATSGVFLSVLLSVNYLFHPLQSRAWTAVVSVHDTFIWCGYAMVVMGIVAVAVWDSLTLDARDTAILSPLPVARGRIVRAQVAAVLLFGLGFDLSLNAIPTAFAPLVRVSRLPIHLDGLARLIGASAASTMAAGAFGFVTVLAIRESLRAVLGAARFERVAPAVQGILIALLATSFLSLPAAASHIDERWLAAHSGWAPPPLWFAGLQERLTGNAIVGLAPTEPPADAPAAHEIRAAEARMMRRYESRRGALDALAGRAVQASALVGLVMAMAWAWNSRRWPALPASRRDPQRSGIARVLLRLEGVIAADPAARAGFAFARQTFTRSAAHRVRIAATCGVALALAAATLDGIHVGSAVTAVVPTALFAVQTVTIVVLAIGYRRATRVPADTRASATFQIAGLPDIASFVGGIKRAGIVLLGAPVLCLLWPLQAVAMGWGQASAHWSCGVLLLLIVMEVLFQPSEDVPLVSPRQPTDNGLALGVIGSTLGLVVVWAIGAAERVAYRSVQGTGAWLGLLLVIWLALATLLSRRTTAPLISWTYHDHTATERLGLAE